MWKIPEKNWTAASAATTADKQFEWKCFGPGARSGCRRQSQQRLYRYEWVTYSFIYMYTPFGGVWFHGERIIHQSGCPAGKVKNKKEEFRTHIQFPKWPTATVIQHNCAYANWLYNRIYIERE
jgi:hypothetical protein